MTVVLVAWGLAYLLAARRARRWPRSHTAAFLGGLVVLALASRIDAEARLSAHMVQHLLLTLGAPPLLVLGRPVALALRVGIARRPLARLLASPLGHPAVVLAVFAGVLVATHVPAFYDAALRHGALHALEHALYLGSALAFWQVVLAPAPHPHAASPLVRMLLVLAAMLPMAAVGVALLVADDVVYSSYHTLADQRRAAAIMWLWGTLALAVAVIAAGWWAVVREHRRQLAREAAR